MAHAIWLTEGLSSQRDLIRNIRLFAQTLQVDLTIFASHRQPRHEILSEADFSLTEPADENERLAFILSVTEKYGIPVIHAGRNIPWFETHRNTITASGTRLITGVASLSDYTVADDKVRFAAEMASHGLPVVPSVQITSAAQLRDALSHSPFPGLPLCIKPVQGIYGAGFWQFDDNAQPMAMFTNPERRITTPQQYLSALESADKCPAQVLMPYLPGPEYSVDILADNGEVLAAVARRKDGSLQYLEHSGAAFELACACARVMKADGLVNVQTRHDHHGQPLLLEINMRPSGGIGYTALSGVNLPGLFALYSTGLLSADEVREYDRTAFCPAIVRPLTEAVSYPSSLNNAIH
ncbi:ATP-grasp domain-containing protein [Morganella morganii]|uniref:ATP-grasp domain-containing protein n=2 Tax=Enterobacterales TaxID=91347 RepID=UPI001BD9B739|nr:ATP-grasp domain-containing protein [Morganella morganii]MBT0317203.1 ATP-grasp domain-containing protein [Morganella morganii subsp. morganii]MBT0371320.1 ATP-grasp domain-containing protein [Morganella morganii subsp. morganii]MBT0444054.1 ATP-grasp domain-containing protein [Morganella morganii subsp. morganii]HCR4017399.1 ATP-grasp domain-containing protein [Morganella morganii]HDU8707173.1 ATP-grasp domain-containing protein [Morganella morganii subsp. morganii]